MLYDARLVGMLHGEGKYSYLSGRQGGDFWLKPKILLDYPLAEANGNEWIFESLPSVLTDGIFTEKKRALAKIT